MPRGKIFNDTANHRAKDSIAFVSGRKLFDGTGAYSFASNETMSRAMRAAAILRRLVPLMVKQTRHDAHTQRALRDEVLPFRSAGPPILQSNFQKLYCKTTRKVVQYLLQVPFCRKRAEKGSWV